MIAIQNETGHRGQPAAFDPAGWLGLAAAPTFAAMALLTFAAGSDADVMCSTIHGASALGWPALGGMVPMYALMSAFHAAPWLKLISRR
jgi:hypothetical protein